MKITDITKFSIRLILAKKTRFIFTILLIAFAVMSVFIFMSFSNGIKDTIRKNILSDDYLNKIIITPEVGSISFLQGKSKLTYKNFEELKKIQHVQSVERQMLLFFPNSIRASMLGIKFDTDVPIFGIDGIQTKEDNQQKIPIVISPKIIDIFNSSFSEYLPGRIYIKEKDLLGKRLKIDFGRSSFFNFNFSDETLEKTVFIAEISDSAPIIGLAIPMETAMEINKIIGGKSKNESIFNKFIITVDNKKNINIVKKEIKSLGLKPRDYKETNQTINKMTSIIDLIIIFTGVILSILAFFALFSILSISVIEQRKNIGILNILGLRKKYISLIFIFQSIIISTIGAIIGFIFGILAIQILDTVLTNAMPNLSFIPNSIFIYNSHDIFKILLLVILMAIIFAILPARTAEKQDPIKVIWS